MDPMDGVGGVAEGGQDVPSDVAEFNYGKSREHLLGMIKSLVTPGICGEHCMLAGIVGKEPGEYAEMAQQVIGYYRVISFMLVTILAPIVLLASVIVAAVQSLRCLSADNCVGMEGSDGGNVVGRSLLFPFTLYGALLVGVFNATASLNMLCRALPFTGSDLANILELDPVKAVTNKWDENLEKGRALIFGEAPDNMDLLQKQQKYVGECAPTLFAFGNERNSMDQLFACIQKVLGFDPVDVQLDKDKTMEDIKIGAELGAVIKRCMADFGDRGSQENFLERCASNPDLAARLGRYIYLGLLAEFRNLEEKDQTFRGIFPAVRRVVNLLLKDGELCACVAGRIGTLVKERITHDYCESVRRKPGLFGNAQDGCLSIIKESMEKSQDYADAAEGIRTALIEKARESCKAAPLGAKNNCERVFEKSLAFICNNVPPIYDVAMCPIDGRDLQYIFSELEHNRSHKGTQNVLIAVKNLAQIPDHLEDLVGSNHDYLERVKAYISVVKIWLNSVADCKDYNDSPYYHNLKGEAMIVAVKKEMAGSCVRAFADFENYILNTLPAIIREELAARERRLEDMGTSVGSAIPDAVMLRKTVWDSAFGCCAQSVAAMLQQKSKPSS
jgi:hypothetical protein